MNDIKIFDKKFEKIVNQQDPTLFNEIIGHINLLIQKDNENFFGLCYWFMRLKKHFDYAYKNPNMYFGGYTSKNGDRYVYEHIIREFGLDDKTVYKMIQVAEKFLTYNDLDNFYSIKPYIVGFSRSKIFELLPLSETQFEFAIKNKQISSDSSVKVIREYVKSLKGTTKSNNKVLEEPQSIDEQLKSIEATYDPKKHYDFTYFESKSKSQLLNIVWELQKEIEKLRGVKK